MYKFKSPAAADLIMLEPNGKKILSIIGKDSETQPAKGIVLPAEMPAAIVALQAAIVAEDEARARIEAQAKERGEDAPRLEGISFKQRAVPFIEMLTRCQKANQEIVWGG